MNFKLPQYVVKCLKTLKNAKIESYLVGGCVRDMLMGIVPHDYDITVNALPEKIKPLFERTVDTGIKHGTVTAIIDGKPIEITTMRTDGEYLNHRKPENVTYTSSLEEDLQRRDFTVNAVAMDYDGKIYDYFGGIDDLHNGILRAVGEPNLRFDEDALRILRAFRFSSQLEFDIEKATQKAAIEKAYLLQNISAERIYTELGKTLLGKAPNAIFSLINCGAFEFMGLCSPKKRAKKREDSDCCLPGYGCIEKLPNEKAVRLAALIMICNADEKRVLKSLKTENSIAKSVESICKLSRSEQLCTEDIIQMKSLINQYGICPVKDALTVKSTLCEDDFSAAWDCFEKAADEPIYINQLDISGRDLIELGIHGEQIGKCLEHLQRQIWKNAELNEKTKLIDIAKNMKS